MLAGQHLKPQIAVEERRFRGDLKLWYACAFMLFDLDCNLLKSLSSMTYPMIISAKGTNRSSMRQLNRIKVDGDMKLFHRRDCDSLTWSS